MKKILVINNDIDTMALLKSWLEKKTYKVKYTGNQLEASELIKEFEPDLIMIDVLQKDVLEDLEAAPRAQDVPVILMTGYTLRPKVNEMSVYDTIEKPFNLPLLEKKIRRLVS